jgi:hypothetical protein
MALFDPLWNPVRRHGGIGRLGGMANAGTAGTITLGDLTVNRMGFGAMRITGEGIWGPPRDHDTAVAVPRRAVELGVNFIDTANAAPVPAGPGHRHQGRAGAPRAQPVGARRAAGVPHRGV